MRSCHQTKACGDKKEIFSPLVDFVFVFFSDNYVLFPAVATFQFPSKDKNFGGRRNEKINSFYWAL